ncbi:MAG TPA: 50S ribosomal protein L37ae [Candidatus Nanoarchaeia archaeon]|nr:50S ribosomal protein L37ae [Candidatus Nanoarchaeia archaeon]
MANTTRRFGARYGIKVRKNVEKIEVILRRKHVCPYCKAPAVRRKAVGIWSCRKCKSVFTARAYDSIKTVIASGKTSEPK